jgi:hypothetical protein
MPVPAQSAPPKLIVIPRPLEGFFYERLTRQFAGRDDLRVVVDRRAGERRHPRWVAGPGPFSERRHGDRRGGDVAWSLPDMPFSAS